MRLLNHRLAGLSSLIWLKRQFVIAPNLPLSGNWINLHIDGAIKLGAGSVVAKCGTQTKLEVDPWLQSLFGGLLSFYVEFWGVLDGLILF